MLALHHFNSFLSILSTVISLSLAGLLFIKKSDDRMGLFLSFYLLAHGILLAGSIEMLEPIWPEVARVNSFILLPTFTGPLTTALIGLFPDGRFVPRWSGWLVPATILVSPAASLIEQGGLPPSPDFLGRSLTGVVIVASMALFVAVLYVPIYRYRHISTPEQRQQTKWVIFGIFLWFIFLLISTVPWVMTLNLPTGSSVPWWFLVAQFFWFSSTAIFPVALTIAVMRYRLFDIDLIINRTLVYGTLTTLIVIVYVITVSALGLLFRSEGNLLFSLIATGLVAVLFQPLRLRLTRTADRLFYGERANPFAVMAELSQELEEAKSPNEMLTDLVSTVAKSLKLPYAGIVVQEGDRQNVLAAWGRSENESQKFALIYQSEPVGDLVVSPRASGEEFNPSEQRLLRSIARHAGAVVHAVKLSEDLKKSRARIVRTREEERRRLRRDLHDGLGASLAALHIQTGVLKRLIRKDPDTAEEIVDELRAELHESIGEIRRVVYELRPPALDELGLVAAIRAQAARCSQPQEPADKASGQAFHVNVKAPHELPPLPAAVEVALYRITLEALTNTVRHAQARQCTVTISLNHGLQVEIVDDGIGISQEHEPGIGLHSMQERAVEIGGWCSIESNSGVGTRIRAWVPLPEECLDG